MGKVIAMHPVELEADVDDAVSELTTCLMRPVFEMAEAVEARFEAEGMPRWRSVHVTVHVSEQLRVALEAEGAFDLIVKYDEPA